MSGNATNQELAENEPFWQNTNKILAGVLCLESIRVGSWSRTETAFS